MSSEPVWVSIDPGCPSCCSCKLLWEPPCVQYIGGYYQYIGEYHEYIGGCSVHRLDTMMHAEGYHKYIRGCSVHWRPIRGDIMMNVGGHHEYIRECSVHRSKAFIDLLPHMNHDVPLMY